MWLCAGPCLLSLFVVKTPYISGQTKLVILFCAAVVVVAGLAFILNRDPSQSGSRTPTSLVPQSPAEMGGFPTADLQKAEQSWRQRAAAASPADFRSLMNDALQIQDSALRDIAVAQIVAAWMNEDAQSFSSYFASLEVLAATDAMPHLAVLSALKKALTQLSEDAARSQYVLAIVERFVAALSKSEPEEALRWAEQFLVGGALDSALVSIARESARSSPERAQQIIAKIEAPLRRMQAMHAVGGVWAQADAARALAWAGSLEVPTERALTLNSVLLSVAQKDVALASSELFAATKKIASEYTTKRKADMAALKLTEEDLVNDPERYKEMLEAGEIAPPVSPDIELLAESARVIATRLAETDPQLAIAWADSLGHDFLRLKSITGAFAGWSRKAPAEAFAYYQRTYPEYNEMLTSVFEGWTSSNPAQAASAALAIQEPRRAQLALETVVQRWVTTADPAAVAKWVDQLPVNQRSDSVEMTLVTALSSVAPEQSWRRAQGITNGRLRYRALKSAFAVLVIEKPDLARSLLASANLEANHAERFQEMLTAVGAGG